MITLKIGDQNVTFVPRSLQNYIDKIDYIKSRRQSPYDCLGGIPETMSAEGKQKMAEIAFLSYMKLSSVSFEEELQFDCSFEGFYYAVWQAAKSSISGWEKLKPAEGVAKARIWFEGLDKSVSAGVSAAVRGIDQRSLAKNSDGPQENPS